MSATTRPDTDAGAFARQHRPLTVGLLTLVTMFAFEAVAVSLAMPSVARDLHGETLYPIAVIGMLTAAVVGMVVGGTWSDARGPAAPLLLGGLGFTAGLLVSGLAGSMEVFVAGRLGQGLGSGLALSAMYVVVADAYPTALRARVFALFATAWVLPSVVGPFVAGALVDLLGWRSVFLAVAVFAAGSTAFVRLAVRGRLAVRSAPLVWGRRPAYAVAAAAGAVALHLAGHETGAGGALVLLGGLAVVLLAVPPLLPRRTLRAGRGLPSVVLARALFGGAFACVAIFLPLVLQTESGISPTLTGLVVMVGALGWTAGSAYTGRTAGPGRFTRVLTLGAVALVLGAVVCLLLVPVDHRPWAAAGVALVGNTVMCVGMGLATPVMSTMALDLAPAGREGESGAAVQLSDALGQSVVAGLVGAVFARWFLVAPHTSYVAGFGAAALVAVAALPVVRRTRVG